MKVSLLKRIIHGMMKTAVLQYATYPIYLKFLKISCKLRYLFYRIFFLPIRVAFEYVRIRG